MSDYYNIPRKDAYNYNPRKKNNFKLSRSRIDLFIECPRCFYLDCRLGIKRPPGYPFNLNTAVDTLLKKEFDLYRADNKQHPLQKKYKIGARPVAHKELDIWRENFKGVQVEHEPTGFTVTGAIDDLWVEEDGSYAVVDYKSTSKGGEITALDQEWQDSYKRQMEVYQWLLRQKGLTVSDTGYFVYCNGRTDAEAFDGKLEFDITLIPYKGDDGWVEKALTDAHKCLKSSKVPEPGKGCDYCRYREVVQGVE